MTYPGFKIGDVVQAVSQGTHQTPPLKIVNTEYRNNDVYYKLDDETSSTLWPDVEPGDKTTWALLHLRLGFSVIPIEPGGKRPPFAGGVTPEGHKIRYGWKRYQEKKALESTIISWAERWPEMNHAIATGALSGVVVLDIDEPEGAQYAKDHGLPATPTATSGNGKHYYFKCPGEELGSLRNKARPVPGLDLRGEGGYIVAPGSFHGEKQTTYRWLVPPWECELAPAPDWVIELFKKKKERTSAPVAGNAPVNGSSGNAYADRALENELGRLARTAAGQRNDQLNRSAFALGQLVAAGALSEAEVRQTLSNVAASLGLPEHEADKTITSGLESGKGEPRQIPEQKANLPPLFESADIMDELAELRQQQEKAWLAGDNPPDFFNPVKEIVIKGAMLSESQIDKALDEIERGKNPLVRKKRGEFKRLWQNANKGAQILQAAHVREQRPSSWPYRVQNGRIHFLSERTFQENVTVQSTPVCDFEGQISEQITDENGQRSFRVHGVAVRGGPFEVTLDAEDFGNDRKLRATLDAAAGGKDPVRAGMSKHLGPAIKLLTEDEMRDIKRYTRTGWQTGDCKKFLVRGLEQDGTVIQLPRKLPYHIDKNADLRTGLVALDNLIECLEPARTTVLLAAIFQAPLMRLIDGWSNERYGVFVSGRTGSFKTSIAQVAMSIYGTGFMRDELLVKWGEGATSNAMMGMAVHASDMPFLIDNFKPSTGGGVNSFIGLVHNIVEGGEKDRLNRASELRDTRPIFCLPICTGEDVPDSDPASLARILIVPFPWQRGQDNPKLTMAQEFAEHLPAVGKVWLAWLESDEGRRIARTIAADFSERRSFWSEQVKDLRRDSVNIKRVASNLATNELTWRILAKHPDFGPMASKFAAEHGRGLAEIVSMAMAEATAESLEATRFLAILRELLVTDRSVLLIRDPASLLDDPPAHHKDRQIGWRDEDGIYLLPTLARQAADRHTSDGLNGISSAALYKQLKEMGLIVDHNKNSLLKSVRISKKVHKVLFLNATALEITQD